MKNIDAAADGLDFERAAFWRDILHGIEEFWSNPRRGIRLDDAVDTFDIERHGADIVIILITQRRRRTLGRKIWKFAMLPATDEGQALADVIEQFYEFHLPREIRVPTDFPGRLSLARKLSLRFGRRVPISVVTQATKRQTTERALRLTRDDILLQDLAVSWPEEKIRLELRSIFGLKAEPRRIEAYDAAHISGTSFVAAAAVWKGGAFSVEDYSHWPSDKGSETATLQAFIEYRLRENSDHPDLLVVDGGKAQLAAAIAGAGPAARDISILAAVKPRGNHSGISHFLCGDGRRVDFVPDNPACNLLKVLRDEAHDLANAAHRQSRDMRHFYELAGILPSLNERERQELVARAGSVRKIVNMDDAEIYRLLDPERAALVIADLQQYKSGNAKEVEPLVVPIRFVEPNGAADDLRPIHTR